MTPDTLKTIIEDAWEDRGAVTAETHGTVRDAVERALAGLDRGEFRVAEKNGGPWHVNQCQAEVDAAIKGMPKTEGVDGMTIGFKDMVDMDGAERKSEAGYLVVWRRGDKLIGFVYRSKMKIDFAKLVDLAKLVDAGL